MPASSAALFDIAARANERQRAAAFLAVGCPQCSVSALRPTVLVARVVADAVVLECPNSECDAEPRPLPSSLSAPRAERPSRLPIGVRV